MVPRRPLRFCDRVYAVTMGNIPIGIGFGIITVSQFVLGIVFVIIAAKGGGKTIGSQSQEPCPPGTPLNLLCCVPTCVAETLPQIPFDAYRLCAPSGSRPIVIAYTGISLVYGVLEPSYTPEWY